MTTVAMTTTRNLFVFFFIQFNFYDKIKWSKAAFEVVFLFSKHFKSVMVIIIGIQICGCMNRTFVADRQTSIHNTQRNGASEAHVLYMIRKHSINKNIRWTCFIVIAHDLVHFSIFNRLDRIHLINLPIYTFVHQMSGDLPVA